jgi:hypothetical protein
MNEIHTSNLGLVIAPDVNGFLNSNSLKSTQKVSQRSNSKRNIELQVIDIIIKTKKNDPPSSIPHQYILENINNKLFTPPQWSDTSDGIKAVFYQIAIDQIAKEIGGSSYTVNLNLSSDLIRKGNENGDILDLSRRLVIQSLKRGGVKAPLIWLSLEAVTTGNGALTGQGRPHIHGAIVIPPEHQLKDIKNLIKINNDMNPVFKNHELRMAEIYDGINFAQYALKYRAMTHLFLPGAKLLTRTNRIGSTAKVLYSELRTSIKQAHKQRATTATSKVL